MGFSINTVDTVIPLTALQERFFSFNMPTQALNISLPLKQHQHTLFLIRVLLPTDIPQLATSDLSRRATEAKHYRARIILRTRGSGEQFQTTGPVSIQQMADTSARTYDLGGMDTDTVASAGWTRCAQWCCENPCVALRPEH